MPGNTIQNPRFSNFISSILLIILAALLWWQSGSFPSLDEGYPGPNLFPRIIAIGLGLIGLILFFSNFRMKTESDFSNLKLESVSLWRPIVVVLIVIVFPFLSPLIGFPISLLLVTIVVGLVFQLKWWKAVLTGGITVGIVYLVFSQLLGVLL